MRKRASIVGAVEVYSGGYGQPAADLEPRDCVAGLSLNLLVAMS
jgi:hypothetical protein